MLMRVLLLEGELGASCDAALQLAEAGHTVARCHSQDESSFPCRGLSAHACPLDEGDVDAVVVVRAGEAVEGPERAFGEDGARCALRRHIPLVLAGEVGRSPLGAFATAVSARSDALVEVVEKAAHAPLLQHEATARVAFATVLEAHGLDPRLAEVEVTRAAGQLHVTLVPTGAVPTAVLEMASVRVAGAIRSVDRHPRVIDVVTAAG
jgi:hypothetical protein